MKENFYLKAALKSFLFPSIYLILAGDNAFPDIFEILLSLASKWQEIQKYAPYAAPLISLYILNFIFVIWRADIAQQIYPLYELNVTFSISSIDDLVRKLNGYTSKYNGLIMKYDDIKVCGLFAHIDYKMSTHLSNNILPDPKIFRNISMREKVYASCDLPLALKRADFFWHKYYIQKSETIMKFNFTNHDSMVSFQSYLKFKSHTDLKSIMFNLDLWQGIKNAGKYMICPVYEQFVMEDINSKGGGKVSAEFYCFIPFTFFPDVTIKEILFCICDDGKYYPVAKGILEPKLK